MTLVIAFLLGMGNFACHAAVLGSGHRVLVQMEAGTLRMARGASLVLEFAMLCGALYAANHGAVQWVWLYAGYTLLNIGAAWALAMRRL